MKTTKEQREELRRALDNGGFIGADGFRFADGLFVDDDALLPMLLDDLDEMERERDAIARARDCSALDSQGRYEFGPEDGSCALPAGNTCDRHLLMAAAAEAQRLQRLRWQQTWPGMSPGRKKLHLMIAQGEAEAEDARREFAKVRRKALADGIREGVRLALSQMEGATTGDEARLNVEFLRGNEEGYANAMR